MAIKRTITVDGIEVPFKASAAVPRLYRIKFSELDLLTIGVVNDMFTEKENDEYDGWSEVAGQADFDAF